MAEEQEKTEEKPKAERPKLILRLVKGWLQSRAKRRQKRAAQKQAREARDGIDTGNPGRRLALTLVLLCLALCVVAYFMFFTVGMVKINGASVYTEEEIISAMGLDIGRTHIYSFNAFTVAKRVRQRCPQIAEFVLRRHPPTTLVVTVKEEMPRYYASFYGECRALTETLRVLERTDVETAETDGLVRILLPGVTKAIAGDCVTFKDAREERLIYSLLENLAKADFMDRVTGIDVRNVYDIRIVVDGLYRLEFGETSNFDVKIRATSAILRNEDFQRYGTVKMRVIIPDKGAFVLIPAADMDLYG